MTAMVTDRARRRLSACRAGALAAITAVAVVTAHAAIAATVIPVILDEAKIVKLPDRVATLVVGNPLIADVSVQPGGVMVVTGKGYGVTNIVALDRDGRVLMDRAVQVQGPREKVVFVYRGVERESYSCTPKCERRITLGDSPSYFTAVLGQTDNRSGQAAGGGQAASK